MLTLAYQQSDKVRKGKMPRSEHIRAAQVTVKRLERQKLNSKKNIDKLYISFRHVPTYIYKCQAQASIFIPAGPVIISHGV